jgi:hypothetical protein
MQYLLGTLPPDDETRIEEAFFADDTKFEELEVAESELIDAYVQERLSPEDRRQFEAKLRAVPALLERVKFARLLQDKAAEVFSSEQDGSSAQVLAASRSRPTASLRWWDALLSQPAFRVVFAAGVFVILVGGVGLLLGSRQLRTESNQLASDRAAWQKERQERDRLYTEQQVKTEQQTAELQRESDRLAEDRKRFEELQRTEKQTNSDTRQPFVTTLATIFLRPGSLRGGGGRPELDIGPRTITARVQLALEKEDYPAYNAVIKTADEIEVFRQNGLKPQNTGSGHQLILSVPSKRLSPGDYTVHVDGVTASGQVESVDDYAFRIKIHK